MGLLVERQGWRARIVQIHLEEPDERRLFIRKIVEVGSHLQIHK
jgi:hypothetical protein